MSYLVYYVFIYPLSFLPLRWLYVISDALSMILKRVLKYRSKVIKENLNLAFPDRDENYKNNLMNRFYDHLSDLVVESVKSFSISNKQIRKRYAVKGVECTFKDLEKNRNIIVVSAHYANWEWAALSCPLYFKHKCAVIITPLSDPFMNKKLAQSRGRNGYDLVPKQEVKDYISEDTKTPRAIFFLSDQSPSNPDRAYWTQFMGIETAVQYGVEKYAREYNMPIYYIHVERDKRGYYDVTVEPLIKEPRSLDEGQIIEKVTRHIESKIASDPGQWLWSHRRWKHKKRVEN